MASFNRTLQLCGWRRGNEAAPHPRRPQRGARTLTMSVSGGYPEDESPSAPNSSSSRSQGHHPLLRCRRRTSCPPGGRDGRKGGDWNSAESPETWSAEAEKAPNEETRRRGEKCELSCDAAAETPQCFRSSGRCGDKQPRQAALLTAAAPEVSHRGRRTRLGSATRLMLFLFDLHVPVYV